MTRNIIRTPPPEDLQRDGGQKVPETMKHQHVPCLHSQWLVGGEYWPSGVVMGVKELRSSILRITHRLIEKWEFIYFWQVQYEKQNELTSRLANFTKRVSLVCGHLYLRLQAAFLSRFLSQSLRLPLASRTPAVCETLDMTKITQTASLHPPSLRRVNLISLSHTHIPTTQPKLYYAVKHHKKEHKANSFLCHANYRYRDVYFVLTLIEQDDSWEIDNC